MTAEIAIVNRQAIALAADSAVTIGRERVWKHSNKLFSLGPRNDIAIMIYGSGEFAGFPWETIVKTFRNEAGGKQFKTVKDCGSAFDAFLRDPRFAPDQLNRTLYHALIPDELEQMKAEMPEYGSKADFKVGFAVICDQFEERYKEEVEIDPSQSYKDFCSTHQVEFLKELAEEAFKEELTLGLVERLRKVMYEFTRRTVESDYATGVVVAGYGSQEFFPSVYEYKVDGRDGAFVRSWLKMSNDLNRDESSKTVVIPFAQSDIFHLFMEGISPEYIEFVSVLLARVLDNKSDRLVDSYVSNPGAQIVERALQQRDNLRIVEEFQKEFGQYRRKLIVQPIVSVVRALPKEEMAEMAAALVELTSLRRKVDSTFGVGRRTSRRCGDIERRRLDLD